MAGSVAGGKSAARTNKLRHGEDFYARIGAIGGRRGHVGGFSDKEFARKMGAIGGAKSRRGPAKSRPKPSQPTTKRWRDIILPRRVRDGK